MKAQMKISRRKFIAAAVLLMTALTGTLVYAAYVSSAKVANSFSSGGVNIEAECLQERDGELVPAGELTVADLDSVVSYIPVHICHRYIRHGARSIHRRCPCTSRFS